VPQTRAIGFEIGSPEILAFSNADIRLARQARSVISGGDFAVIDRFLSKYPQLKPDHQRTALQNGHSLIVD
jgi:hypothetical protein